MHDHIESTDLVDAFGRFIHGDWGNVDSHSSILNDVALASGEPVIAEYRSMRGVPFWITRQDSHTAVTLPQAERMHILPALGRRASRDT